MPPVERSAAGLADPARRTALTALPAGALGIAASLVEAAAPVRNAVHEDAADEGFIELPDEVERFKALFRFERDLRDEATTLTTYQFITYALPQGERPRPVVRWEGMEFSYFRRVGPLTWRIHAHNVSYPRDLQTGEFTATARNPFTGAMLDIAPMKLLEDPGVLHGPRGYLPLDAKTVRWLDTYHVLRREGPLVKSEHIRPTPDGWPKVFIESSCATASSRDFFDPQVTALPFQTSGFYVAPFPRWMGMGDTAGHMLGAWSGRRAVGGVRDLPRSFVARLRGENPELLEPRWAELERPLSPLIAEALQA